MGLLRLASLSLFFFQLAFLGMAGRHWGSDDDREIDRHSIHDQIMDSHVLSAKPKQESPVAHGKGAIDPALNVFFTLDDLKVGKRMPIYFPNKSGDHSKSPRLLTREQSDSIPFSSAQLSHLLSFFAIPEGSPQAKAMEYTLKQCELEPIAGEARFCAASLESMLDSARDVFGPKAQLRVLTTTYLPNKKKKKAGDDPLQNYTILQAPKRIDATRVIGCHTMPYPYAVFYCHSQAESENRAYRISLGSGGGEDGGGETSVDVEAVAVCHMDTTLWDRDHVSFRVLGVEPGSSPVCHFFPADNLVWVAS